MVLWVFFLSIVGMAVFVVLFAVAAFKKQPKKVALIGFGLCFVVFMVNVSIGDTETANQQVIAGKTQQAEEVIPEKVNEGNKEADREPEVETEPVAKKEPSEKSKIEKTIRSRATEKYTHAKITRIAVNKNMAADDGTHIVLVYLDFDIPNTVQTGNSTMRMYSDDLVANMSSSGISTVCETAVFWEDEYNDRTLKYAYEYRDGGFYLTDKTE